MRFALDNYSDFAGIICIGPTLDPAPTVHSCPGQTVTYTCHDEQIHTMEWIIEPYIPGNDAIKYVAAHLQDTETLTKKRGNISTNLIYVTQCCADESLANMTTKATVHASQLENGSNITCRTTRGVKRYYSHSTLYIAGNILQPGTIIVIVVAIML